MFYSAPRKDSKVAELNNFQLFLLTAKPNIAVTEFIISLIMETHRHVELYSEICILYVKA